MRIYLTASELIEKGLWDAYCEEHGISVWAVNEGLMSGEEELEVWMEDGEIVVRKEK